ncbi:unnamed protein product [Larinioides sclopetarius]|uniref:Nuclease HARBI1 n=1 Tax=Larinioides sclopetarius TaxID=280406 RepID=A0AAV2BKQ6_9ARAC
MTRKDALSTEIKVLCALNFFAFGSYHKKVGNDIPILMSQGSISHSIREVSEAMSKNLLQKYVNFPDDQSAQKTVKEEFFKCCELEGVLGTVDCTHVAIIAPSNDGYHHESNYVNIRGWQSINVQLKETTPFKTSPTPDHTSGINTAFTIFTSHIKHMDLKINDKFRQKHFLSNTFYPLTSMITVDSEILCLLFTFIDITIICQ